MFVSGRESNRSEKWKKKKEIELEKVGVESFKSRLEPTKVHAVEITKKDYSRPEIQEAMREEIKKWNKFDAFELVEDAGQEKIDKSMGNY